MTYKLLTPAISGDPVNTVLRKSDSACIPFDSDNTDYQEYLKWVSEGNTPEAAE
tara:strand:- start:63 stop:224 length:162 start_codon:yes stop_codon:yes gene_type:complete